MKVLIVYADGFEDVEAIATRDVLVRAGLEVIDATINESKMVETSHHMHLHNFKYVKDVDCCDIDAIVLPGGSRGVQNLLRSDVVDSLLFEFRNSGKLICAICAAPMVLAKNGLLHNLEFTCYPGCEVGLDGVYTGKEIVVTDKIITGRSMLYSIPFGLAIIEKLLGKEKKELIHNQIAGLK